MQQKTQQYKQHLLGFPHMCQHDACCDAVNTTIPSLPVLLLRLLLLLLLPPTTAVAATVAATAAVAALLCT
jgi:hypothetical protein